MGKKRNQYTREYKVEAVRLIVEEEKGYRQIAEQRLKEKKYFPVFFVFLIHKK